jgi:hypothetical protein
MRSGDDRPFGAIFIFEGLDLQVAPDVDRAEGYIEPYDVEDVEIYDELGRRLKAEVIGADWPKRISISIADADPRLSVVIDRVRSFLERKRQPIPSTGDPAAWIHEATDTLLFRKPSASLWRRIRNRLGPSG